MPSDAANKIKIKQSPSAAATSPALRVAAETAGLAIAQAPSNDHGKGIPSGINDAPANPAKPAIEDVKKRMGAVLERMKSRTEAIDTAGLPPANPGKSLAPAARASTEEMERRKTQIVAAARAAEAKAREAEEKFRQVEARLEAEVAQRLEAEQRIRNAEETYKQQIESLESEELKRLEVEEALAGVETRLVKEVLLREEAEKELARIRARAEETARTARNAEARKAEAEAKARSAEEVARDNEAKARAAEEALREAEAKARAAEETVREVEGMIHESDAIAASAHEKFKAVEARLLQETELRIFAEQQLKALADELNVNLEVDWSKLDSDLARASTADEQTAVTEEFYQQLLDQIETERQARISAERAHEEAEAKAHEMQSRLVNAAREHAQAEARYEELLQRQQLELRELQLQIAGDAAPMLTLGTNIAEPIVLLTLDTDAPAFSSFPPFSAVEERKNQSRFIGYGLAILTLLVILIFLSFAAYQQL